MFRLTIYSIVISLIVTSVTCQTSSPEYSTEFDYDKSEETSVVDLDNGDYVVELVNKLLDCSLEKKTNDLVNKRLTYLENLYAESLNARNMSSLVPMHLSALSQRRKEICTPKA